MNLLNHLLRQRRSLRSGHVSDEEVCRAIRSVPRHYAANAIFYTGANTQRGPSPIIWQKFPRGEVHEDPSKGFDLFDDFKTFGGTVTSNVGTYASEAGGYKSYEVTSGSVKQLNVGPTNAAVVGGAIRLLTVSSTANACTALESGYGNGGVFQVNGNVRPKLFFEARVKVGAITGSDYFIGLMEKGIAGNNFGITTGDAIGSKNLIGFWTLTAAGSTINAGWRANGQAAQSKSTTGVYVANTYTKLGFVYDPEDTTSILKFYQDGVLLNATAVTDVTAATFPNATPLAMGAIAQNDATGTLATNLDIDWWRAGQLYL